MTGQWRSWQGEYKNKINPYCHYVQHRGQGVANRICKTNILGSNPMDDCVQFLSGVKCHNVQEAMAHY